MVVNNNSEFPSWIGYQLIPSDFGCYTGGVLFNKNAGKSWNKCVYLIRKCILI